MCESFVRFVKMHGSGNDFVIIDSVSRLPTLDERLIPSWSDRRMGIGFDQLLIIHPPRIPGADFRMQIFNADGTEAEQCGNGARCVALFTLRKRLTHKRKVVLEVDGGLVTTHYVDEKGPGTALVEAEFDAPVLLQEKTPSTGRSTVLFETLQLGGDSADTVSAVRVSMGNPHAVIHVDSIANIHVHRIGFGLQSHSMFPNGTNVEFMEIVHRKRARLRIFERGAGETLACGTGACAAMIVGRLSRKLDSSAEIEMPGGTVRVTWESMGKTVRMMGEAVWVYEGVLPL